MLIKFQDVFLKFHGRVVLLRIHIVAMFFFLKIRHLEVREIFEDLQISSSVAFMIDFKVASRNI